jgi:hypothetical protein
MNDAWFAPAVLAAASERFDLGGAPCHAQLELDSFSVEPSVGASTSAVAQRVAQVNASFRFLAGLVVDVSIVAPRLALVAVPRPPANLTHPVMTGVGAARGVYTVTSFSPTCFQRRQPPHESSAAPSPSFVVQLEGGEPFPPPVVASATKVTIAVASLASTVAGSPATGGMLARTAVIGAVASCGDDASDDDDGIDLGWTESPLGMQVGDGSREARANAGAAIGNLMLTLAAAAVFVMGGIVYSRARGLTLLLPRADQIEPDSLTVATSGVPLWLHQTLLVLNYARIPSLTSFPIAFLAEPTMRGAMIAIIHPNAGNGARLAGIVAAVVMGGICVVFGRFVFRAARHRISYKRRKEAVDRKFGECLAEPTVKLKLRALGGVVFHTFGEWQDTVSSTDRCGLTKDDDGKNSVPNGSGRWPKHVRPSFLRMTLLFFADYTDRCRYFFVIDVALAFGLAAAETYVSAYGGCRGAAAIVMLLLLAYLGATAYIRPYESRFQHGFALFFAGVQAVASVLALVHSVTRNEASGMAVQVLLLLSAAACVLRTVLDVARVVLRTLQYRARKLHEARPTFGSSSRYLDPLLLDALGAQDGGVEIAAPIELLPVFTASNEIRLGVDRQQDGSLSPTGSLARASARPGLPRTAPHPPVDYAAQRRVLDEQYAMLHDRYRDAARENRRHAIAVERLRRERLRDFTQPEDV